MKTCPLCKTACPCKCMKMLIPILIGFVWISLFEFVLHGVLLRPQYEATASLWRGPQEMNFPLMMAFQFFMTAVLFCIYKCGFEKNAKGGLKFGVKLGMLCGLGMAYTYVWMPIPALLAVEWFAGNALKIIGLGVLWGFLAQKFCKGEICSTGEGGKGCG